MALRFSTLFLKFALIVDQMAKEMCSAYKQHAGRVSEHKELWANLARLGRGSCSRERPQIRVRERRLGPGLGKKKQERGQVTVIEQAGKTATE